MANEAAVCVVQVTFSESLIDCEQVQVDNIVQVERHSPVLVKQESPAVADKPARRLRKLCRIYVRAVGL